MNSKHDIRMLTERFFNGETTFDEERLLYSLYQSDEVPEDLQTYREMMLDMAAINQPQAKTVPLWQRPALRWIAAAVVALAVGWGGMTLFTPNSNEECVAYIYGQLVTDQAVVMNELSHTVMSMADSRKDDNVAQQLDEMFNLE